MPKIYKSAVKQFFLYSFEVTVKLFYFFVILMFENPSSTTLPSLQYITLD